MIALQASKRGTNVCVNSHMTASPLFSSSDYSLYCFERGTNLTVFHHHLRIQVWSHFLCCRQIHRLQCKYTETFYSKQSMC